ncbi:hypothetical protein LTR08_008839 [Meristemomyces frigidus]|nr:hypothetical protein LTR08_008839 [Meristemomyces frigidus]
MPGEPRRAKCTRRGRACVRTSWAALDSARDSLSDSIAVDEKKREQLIAELMEVQARIDRSRKVRAQAEARAREKMECFMRELEATGDPILMEDVASTEFGLEAAGVASPFVWDDSLFHDLVPLEGTGELATSS